MQIDYMGLNFWVGLGQWAFNLIVAYTLWVSKNRQAANKRLDEIEHKVIKVCSDLENLPGHDQFKELNNSIAALNGNIKTLEGRFEGVNRAVDLINEFLITQGGKK